MMNRDKIQGLQIRPMQEADVIRVAQIEKETFSDPWKADDFYVELGEPEHCYLVAADEEGHIYGYCGFWGVVDEGQIYNVAVAAEARGFGLGRLLLSELLAEGNRRGLRMYTLEVREGNDPAIRLYKSLGFETVGIRKNFYTKPTENAILMTLEME